MAVTAAHDFETFATVDLKKTGVDSYAEHVETGVHCMAWRLSPTVRGVWRPGDPDPTPFLDHIAAGGALSAWNAPFEMGIWHWVIRRICPHWPQPRLEQFYCTMARALALALPGALERCAEALKLPIEKDKTGYRLMMKMCRPTTAWRKWNENRTGPEPVKWHREPADLMRLAAYCANDVDVEVAIGERVAPLTPRERENWLLNERVNRRGIRLDLARIGPALKIVAVETGRLNAELNTLTGGAVPRVTNTQKMLDWLSDELHPLPDLKKRTVETALAQRVNNSAVRRVLEIRREAGKASVAKLKAMLACVNRDGRARGLLGYHTATTGRAASRRIQVQNFIRAFLKHSEIAEILDRLLEVLGDDDLEYVADCIRFGYADPIAAIASCLRSLIIASPGRVLIGGDYSNIEGRIIAWLAGEKWKLDAFRAFDAGEGKDLYILSYARSFGADPAEIGKDDPRRQVGKVQELSLGYMGGPFALLSMCLLYGMNVADLADAVEDVTERWVWEETERRYPEEIDKQRGLTQHVWTGLRVVVDAWRDAHPNIVDFWYDLEECAKSATRNPHSTFSTATGLIEYRSNGHFLFARLPTGRLLAYATPHIRWVRRSDGKVMPAEFKPTDEDREKRPRPYKQTLLYFGQGKKSKRWEIRKAYGGLLAENVVQGTARDVLFDGMHRVERVGYPIVLHVHDEMIAEVPEDFGSKADFHRLMCEPEPWMKGLPVAAGEPFRSNRYAKN